MQWVPFLLYVIITSFTPGPNNIMAMVFASRFGFAKTVRFLLGVTAGATAIALLASCFNLLLYRFIPAIQSWLSVLGGLYLVYLAVKIMRSKPGEQGEQNDKGNTFAMGFVLQFINPKVILYAITAISSFIIPVYHSNASLILFSLLLGLIGFAANASWAMFGALFQTFLAKYERVFSLAMGLLLLYSAVLIWLE